MQQRKEKFKPLTKNQGLYFRAIETSTVTICTGPAGTGKSFCVCGVASQMLQDERIDKIILTRPLITCGNGIGYLPGNIDDKVGPFMRPLLDAFGEFFDEHELEKLVAEQSIEMVPLDLMRGLSINNSVVIADELQNATFAQLRMLMTRIGKQTRLVMAGDLSQSDLNMRDTHFAEIINRLRNPDLHPEIAIVQFTKDDIVRNGLIRWIEERLEL